MTETTTLELRLEGEGALADWVDREMVSGEPLIICALSGGMESGLPSVALACELPDGKVFFAQTSLRLFLAAADALRARYELGVGDEA